MVATLHEGWSLIEPYISSYGAFAIFVMIYFESLGMPVPGETGVIAAALLAAKGELSIGRLYLAVLSAAILGDGTGYLIGRIGGQAILRRFGPYVGLDTGKLNRIELKFRTRGLWFVMVARFIPVLRQLNGLFAGSLALPWHSFLLAQAVGAAMWTTVYCLGPYFFGELFHLIR